MFAILWWSIWIFSLINCVLLGEKVHVTFNGRRVGANYKAFSRFMQILALIGIFLLITSNRTGTDIINYRNRYMYDHTTSLGAEFIYSVIKEVAYNLGINFYVFRAVCTFLAGALAIKFIYKLKINIYYVILFYMPALFMDSMLFKNSMCLYVLLWAFYFLIDDTKKGNVIKYIITILILSQIHTAYIFYFILLIFKIKEEKNRKIVLRIILFLIIALAALTLVNGNSIPFVDTIFSIIFADGDSRKDKYATSGNWGFLYPTVLHLITTFMLMYGCKHAEIESEIEKKYIELINIINLVSFIFISFLMMNIIYYRYVRNAFFLSTIAAAILLKHSKSRKNSQIIWLCTIIVSILWYIFDMYMFSSPDVLVKPILDDGVLFFLSQ